MTFSRLKHVWLVAAHFPPSNLASVHRARLFANCLIHEGWDVTVLTVNPQFYEERLDPDLEKLVHPAVRVVRVGAIPAGWTRPFGLGDIGIRAFLSMREALNEAITKGKVDLVHITIPSNYQALLGAALSRTSRVPYIIDYIDPWVLERNDIYPFLSKESMSLELARILEPIAVQHASGILGITESYYAGAVSRNPHLRHIPKRALQYGMSEWDFEQAALNPVHPRRLDPRGRSPQLVYAGAFLPKAVLPMRGLLKGMAKVNRAERKDDPVRLLCLGTGVSAKGGEQVRQIAEDVGAGEWLTEFPERHDYLEILATLKAADGIVIVGSTEPHYSPSKLFQAVLARRPVLALLHEKSEAAQIMTQTNAGVAVLFDAHPNENHLSRQCSRVLQHWPSSSPEVRWEAFRPYLAESIAHELASFYDEVLKFHAENVS